ncbi:MAG: hypothetical protein OXG37_02540 [Actinomycetia bacterium]|nr:hypothetical protein [Actinomycetes bacterium]
MSAAELVPVVPALRSDEEETPAAAGSVAAEPLATPAARHRSRASPASDPEEVTSDGASHC